jgi:hypothetical protein
MMKCTDFQPGYLEVAARDTVDGPHKEVGLSALFHLFSIIAVVDCVVGRPGMVLRNLGKLSWVVYENSLKTPKDNRGEVEQLCRFLRLGSQRLGEIGVERFFNGNQEEPQWLFK